MMELAAISTTQTMRIEVLVKNPWPARSVHSRFADGRIGACRTMIRRTVLIEVLGKDLFPARYVRRRFASVVASDANAGVGEAKQAKAHEMGFKNTNMIKHATSGAQA